MSTVVIRAKERVESHQSEAVKKLVRKLEKHLSELGSSIEHIHDENDCAKLIEKISEETEAVQKLIKSPSRP